MASYDPLPTEDLEEDRVAGHVAYDDQVDGYQRQPTRSLGKLGHVHGHGKEFDQVDSYFDSGNDHAFISSEEQQSIPSYNDVAERLGHVHITSQIQQEPIRGKLDALDDDDVAYYSQELDSVPLSAQPNAFAQDEDGDTQLHIAIIQLLTYISTEIIKTAASPAHLNIKNSDSQTPLHLSVLTKQHEVVDTLLKAGAESDIVDYEGNTPLHIACREGDEKSVKLLTQPLKQKLNSLNFSGLSMLHLAAANNHYRLVYYLVTKHAADINIKDGKSGRTILHYAAENDNEHLVEMLLNWSADIEALTYDNATPLRLAAGKSNHRIVQKLLSFGADPMQLSTYSDTDDSEEEMDSIDDYEIGGKPVSM